MRPIFAACLIASLASLAAPPVAAAPTPVDVYDTVDSVENQSLYLLVTGMKNGSKQSVQTEYEVDDPEARADCKRYAVLALSKPGKYTFSVINSGARYCRLTAKS